MPSLREWRERLVRRRHRQDREAASTFGACCDQQPSSSQGAYPSARARRPAFSTLIVVRTRRGTCGRGDRPSARSGAARASARPGSVTCRGVAAIIVDVSGGVAAPPFEEALPERRVVDAVLTELERRFAGRPPPRAAARPGARAGPSARPRRSRKDRGPRRGGRPGDGAHCRRDTDGRDAARTRRTPSRGARRSGSKGDGRHQSLLAAWGGGEDRRDHMNSGGASAGTGAGTVRAAAASRGAPKAAVCGATGGGRGRREAGDPGFARVRAAPRAGAPRSGAVLAVDRASEAGLGSVAVAVSAVRGTSRLRRASGRSVAAGATAAGGAGRCSVWLFAGEASASASNAIAAVPPLPSQPRSGRARKADARRAVAPGSSPATERAAGVVAPSSCASAACRPSRPSAPCPCRPGRDDTASSRNTFRRSGVSARPGRLGLDGSRIALP